MNAQQLYRSLQRTYNNFCDWSNEAFDKYTAKRKKLGVVDASLVHYAEAGTYNNAANSIKLLCELNDLPLIERVTKYQNDVQYDKDRFKDDASEVEVEDEELQEA